MMLLFVVLACGATSADLVAAVDEAACMWVERCTDRFADVQECVEQNPSTVVPGCRIDPVAQAECVEQLDGAQCPAGDLFEPPAACAALWVCDSEQ